MIALSSQTLATQLADLIENSILDGTFKVGEKLKEADLELRYGTSRTPLREALRILDSRGLIQVVPRKGCFVKEINLQDISDVCEITVALEALAVSLVHQRITQDGIKELEQILVNMERALSQRNGPEFIRYHEEYHAKLVTVKK